MGKNILQKTGEIYLEGMKTSAEDLGQTIKGNIPQKRGILGRLKQAAAIGATMLTLGGIGSIKNGIQQHKTDSENKANMEYVEKKYGWQSGISKESPLWNYDSCSGLHQYKTNQEMQDHQEYLRLLSRYLGILQEGVDPRENYSEMFKELDSNLNRFKDLLKLGGTPQLLKRIQMNVRAREELVKMTKLIDNQKSQVGRADTVNQMLKKINSQKPQTQAQRNLMEVTNFKD